MLLKSGFLLIRFDLPSVSHCVSVSVSAVRADCTAGKVREYARGCDRVKAKPYAKGLAPHFFPKGVNLGKMLATCGFASASAPRIFPRKRPFSQGLCPFLRDITHGKR